MTTVKNWFEVDKEGLSKLQERRGKAFVMYELISNAWDTAARKIVADLEVIPGRAYATLRIVDDHPDGWKNLDHAYTLFAESEKKGDPEKRGRFNMGEKMVLALCEEASISTTTGTVTFAGDGRTRSKRRTESGSRFEATIKMTREEYEDVYAAVWKVLPPEGVEFVFNNITIEHRKPLKVVEATLRTEIADTEGILRPTARKTRVEIVACGPRETGSIYEMGLPIVETGDKFHYNVLQKIPLNSERDNVTPAYLRDLRALVMNAVHADLTPEDASSRWANDALEGDVSKEATERLLTLKFGEKRVITDLHDPEANNIAVTKDYTVIPPRAFSAAQWENVRKHGAALPAGQVTPSPKPYEAEGKDLVIVPESDWTPGIARVVAYAKELGFELLGRRVDVRVANKATWPYGATYGPGLLTLNLGRLGHAWFNQGPCEEVDELLVHEFAHETESNHLSEKFHKAICRVAADLCALAITNPAFFKRHGRS